MVGLLADLPQVPAPRRLLFCALCLRQAVVVRDDDVLEPAHLGDVARCPAGHTPDSPGWDQALTSGGFAMGGFTLDGEGLLVGGMPAVPPVVGVVPWPSGTRFGCVVRGGSGGMGVRLPARLRRRGGSRA